MVGVTLAGWLWARVEQDPKPTTRPGEPTVSFGTLTSGGRERTYTYWRPGGATRAAAVPLVVVLHGTLGGSDTIGRWSGFRELAEKERFAVCFPNGIGRSWRDGRVADEEQPAVDDVKFLDELLDKLLADGAVDVRRVYLAGMSSGGMMAQRYALTRPGRVAAIAVIAGSLAKSLAEQKDVAPPVPIILFHGTRDSVVPFEGGPIAQQYGEVLAARDGLKHWAEWNDCRKKLELVTVAAVDPETKTGVTREGFGEGRDGAEALLYVIEGGGHTWPGVVKTRNELLGWKSTKAISATALSWEFFARHPRVIETPSHEDTKKN